MKEMNIFQKTFDTSRMNSQRDGIISYKELVDQQGEIYKLTSSQFVYYAAVVLESILQTSKSLEKVSQTIICNEKF